MPDKPFREVLAVVKGAGELGSGAAYRLHGAGFQVIMTDLARPSCLCRASSFAEAILAGRTRVEETLAFACDSPRQALEIAARGEVAVLADPDAVVVRELGPTVLVDAVMAKRNLGTRLSDAPIVIALGPGFTAGRDAHAVIETKRGHRLGRVLLEGEAEADTGVPEEIAGQTSARLLVAPTHGELLPLHRIGDVVPAGEIVALVGDCPVAAAISGVIRGLLPAGYQVRSGGTIGDLDPLADTTSCEGVSDRALSVGSGVLAAVVELWPRVPAGHLGPPPRGRGRHSGALSGGSLLGPEEYALLGLLLEGPAHGYQLAAAFAEGSELGSVCRLGQSQLYADLAKLETLGLATSQPLAGRRGRERKQFSLSGEGRRLLLRWLAQPVDEVGDLRVGFLVKLYFASRLGEGPAQALLGEQRAAIEAEVKRLDADVLLGGFRSIVALGRLDLARASRDWLRTLDLSELSRV